MDKATIGTNAGIVWRTINESLSDRDLNAAIGWLARENKIEFDTELPDGEEVMHVDWNVYF